MTSLIHHADPVPDNPLDLVEHVLAEHEWDCDRRDDEELAVGVAGRWCDYHLWFCWHADRRALHLSCALDLKVPAAKRSEVHRLLALINARIAVGNFDLCSDDGPMVFRQALLLRGCAGARAAQVEDMMEIALNECDRFYPALQFLLWGGRSADEAMAAALLETVGEA